MVVGGVVRREAVIRDFYAMPVVYLSHADAASLVGERCTGCAGALGLHLEVTDASPVARPGRQPAVRRGSKGGVQERR